MTELLQSSETFYLPTQNELIALAREFCGENGTLTPLSGGHHNSVYAYEMPEETVVVRHPKQPEGAVELLAEFDLLHKLDGHRAPKAIACAQINDTPVAFIEFIEGHHKMDFNALLPKEIDELARAMFDIHSLTSDCFSDNSGKEPICDGTHADYLRAMVCESVVDRLQQLRLDHDMNHYEPALQIIDKGLQKLDTIVAENPRCFSGTTFSLLHHDLNPENIIWGPDGKVTFIDLNPTYGDPLDDVNYTVVNNQGSPNFQNALLAAYKRIAKCGEISSARMEAYTLKNWLDDLVWTIAMCEQHKNDPEKYESYALKYAERLDALTRLLHTP